MQLQVMTTFAVEVFWIEFHWRICLNYLDDLRKIYVKYGSNKDLVGIKGAGYQTIHDIVIFHARFFCACGWKFPNGQQSKVHTEL